MPGQGNNVYIFPAMAMAVFATEATRVTEEMFIVAAQAIADQVSRGTSRSRADLSAARVEIRDVSLQVAERVATCHLRPGPGAGGTTGRRRRADPRSRLPSGLSGVKQMADVLLRPGALEARPGPDPATVIPPVAERVSDQDLHRIVVVGGGAAGLELATRLGDRLGRRGRAHVTLVDGARTHLWKPLLHEVAAGSHGSRRLRGRTTWRRRIGMASAIASAR